jgi:hypothetical protein
MNDHAIWLVTLSIAAFVGYAIVITPKSVAQLFGSRNPGQHPRLLMIWRAIAALVAISATVQVIESIWKWVYLN